MQKYERGNEIYFSRVKFFSSEPLRSEFYSYFAEEK